MSSGISELVMFVATLLIVGSVVGVLAYETSDLSISMKNTSTQVSEQIQDEFKIINDPSQIPYNNGYVFYVKNIGTSAFYFTNSTVTVMINGTVVDNSALSFSNANNNGSLSPGDLGTIVVNVSLSPGYHIITITLYNGISQQFVFEVS